LRRGVLGRGGVGFEGGARRRQIEGGQLLLHVSEMRLSSGTLRLEGLELGGNSGGLSAQGQIVLFEQAHPLAQGVIGGLGGRQLLVQGLVFAPQAGDFRTPIHSSTIPQLAA